MITFSRLILASQSANQLAYHRQLWSIAQWKRDIPSSDWLKQVGRCDTKAIDWFLSLGLVDSVVSDVVKHLATLQEWDVKLSISRAPFISRAQFLPTSGCIDHNSIYFVSTAQFLLNGFVWKTIHRRQHNDAICIDYHLRGQCDVRRRRWHFWCPLMTSASCESKQCSRCMDRRRSLTSFDWCELSWRRNTAMNRRDFRVEIVIVHSGLYHSSAERRRDFVQ